MSEGSRRGERRGGGSGGQITITRLVSGFMGSMRLRGCEWNGKNNTEIIGKEVYK